jgi:hypothetical protein
MTEVANRVAVVLRPGLRGGEAANAAAIVTAGLRCEAFTNPVTDKTGTAHAAVVWNVVILSAKNSSHMDRILADARETPVAAIAFTAEGRGLNNSFDEYVSLLADRSTSEMTVLAIGLFGVDAEVRALTRKCSVFSE